MKTEQEIRTRLAEEMANWNGAREAARLVHHATVIASLTWALGILDEIPSKTAKVEEPPEAQATSKEIPAPYGVCSRHANTPWERNERSGRLVHKQGMGWHISGEIVALPKERGNASV